MNHQPVPSQPTLWTRGVRRIRQWATALAVAATASVTVAPVALAQRLPPPGGGTGDTVIPPPPPASPPAAHLSLSAVVALVVATAVLSAATTLITLALEHRHAARHALAAPATPRGPQAPQPAATDPLVGHADILSSHRHWADDR